MRDLLQRGCEVHVVAEKFAAAGPALPIVPHLLPKVRNRLHRAAAAESCLRTLRLDVIHDMGVGWYCDIVHSHDGSRLAQCNRNLFTEPSYLRPLKRQMHRILPRYREFDALMARQLNDPDRLVMALSAMVARDFQELHGVPPERIRLVYNGVDTEHFSPDRRDAYRGLIRRQLEVRDDEVLFLFVGHDFRRKGLSTVIRAIGRMASSCAPVRLAVVGGKKFSSAHRLASRSRADHVTTFLGSVPDAMPYYAAADAFVLPTFYDPCSLSVLEAAASGLPSITTRVNGAGELLTHGIDGCLLSDPADEQQLAAHMRLLLEPSVRRQMGAAAREMALQHTCQRNCDQIVDIYDEVLDRQSATLPMAAPEVFARESRGQLRSSSGLRKAA